MDNRAKYPIITRKMACSLIGLSWRVRKEGISMWWKLNYVRALWNIFKLAWKIYYIMVYLIVGLLTRIFRVILWLKSGELYSIFTRYTYLTWDNALYLLWTSVCMQLQHPFLLWFPLNELYNKLLLWPLCFWKM